jgi:DNA transformation protein and related proteins
MPASLYLTWVSAMPSKNQEFATYCCELLGSLGPCLMRRMFGGFGISHEGLTVALMIDLGQGEKLWLKADEASRAQFEAAGCQRFTYDRAGGISRSVNYYSAPEEAMDSPQLMAPWARLALEAAVKAASKAVKKPAHKPAKKPAKKPANKTAKTTVKKTASQAAATKSKAQPKLKPTSPKQARTPVKASTAIKA